MLIGYCTFYPLNSDTLTPVLTIGHFSKNRLQESKGKGTKDKVAENKQDKIIQDKEDTNLTDSYSPTSFTYMRNSLQ